MSVWVAGISAAVTIGATIYNSQQQKKANQAAIDAQTNAANQANATQLGLYGQQRADQAPWRNAGANSVGYLSYLMGVPGYQSWKPVDFSTSPTPTTTTPDAGSSSGKKGGWNPVTGFGDKLWSTGGVLGGADGGLSLFGLAAPPRNTGGETATGPTSGNAATMRDRNHGDPNNRRPMMAGAGLPTFSSPTDPGFQQLPSGAHFIGPDGMERMKH